MSEQIRILIADEMSTEAERILREGGLTVDVITGKTGDELKQIIGNYHGLAVRSASKVTADVFAKATNLKIVGRAGVGVDNIDVKAATAAKVSVINTPAGNGTAAGELAIAYMFALARKLPQSTASMKAGKWDKKSFSGVEITGKTLGVVGFGNIGKLVADRGVGLRMKVLAFDPMLPAGAVPPTGVELVTFEDLVKRSDFVTLHIPLVDSTRNLFSRETLLKMKKSAYLINCARGGIVDESALYEVMKSGHLAGAALDVFGEEPCGPLPLFELDNVLASPHTGASTKEAQVKVAIELAEVFVDYFKNGKLRNAVNKVD
ncbi:MAG: hydroxyacid dehydrogenase [Deltaproteobacteria bacterium]|nr:hydroxyacid dehydrogenase [Deltaproteobacteria bacterium]